MSKIRAYTLKYAPLAMAVHKKYGIHPIIPLAQAALESGWGESKQAREAHNYFGLTVGSARAKTPYYTAGRVYNAKTGLKFRTYTNDLDNWLDWGYFIMHFKSYIHVRPHVNDIRAYAKAISGSAYITEANGDNRGAYYKGLIKNAGLILQSVGGKLPSALPTARAGSPRFLLAASALAAGVLIARRW